MSIYSRKKQRRTSTTNLGHLKLSIEEDTGALVVYVFEARGLHKKEGSVSDVYVKLYLLPDPGKHTKVKTKRSKDKDPVFNEKKTFLLHGEEDCSKTLFISVWNRERAGRSDMIGCMSFNVSDLISSNGVKGWYQLLPEEQGRKESIMVPGILSTASSTISLASTMSAPPSTTSKMFAVTLTCGPNGYGFKLRDESPVFISEVAEGLPAHQLEIKVGDMIVEVNGTDVTRANGRMVAEMIKKHRNTLQMILKRDQGGVGIQTNSLAPQLTSLSQASYSMNDISTHSDTIAGTRLRRSQLPSFSSSQQFNYSSSFDGKINLPGLLTQPADSNNYQIEDHSLPPFISRGERATPSRERLPEVPEEHTSGDGVAGVTREKTHSHFNGMSRSSSQASQKSGSGHGIYEVQTQRPFLGNLSFSQPGGLDSVSSNRSYPSRYEVRKRSLGSPLDDNKGLYDLAINSMRTRRGSAGSSLNHASRSKISTGSVGSTEDSAYSTGNSSRSLNHFHSDDHSLSPSIFDLQNRGRSPPIDTAIQKISPTSPLHSEYNPRQMSSSLEDVRPVVEWESLTKLEQKRQRCLNSLIKCEREFCNELKKGIDNYFMPLSNVISDNSHRTIFMSLDRLYELSNYFYSQICQNTVQCNKAPTNVTCYVEEFAAIYHSKLHSLVKSFEAYLRNSESARKEIAVCSSSDGFQRIVVKPSALYSFVEAGSEYLPKMCRLLTVISYNTPLQHPDHKYLTNIIDIVIDLLPPSCNDLRKNWTSEKTVMRNLKSAITFSSSNTIQSFEIIRPGRVLLHEGEAIIFTDKKRKKKVWLLLFSDMLVVTKSRRVLCVMEAPFYLNSVIVQDINCDKDELQISTEDGVSMRQFKFASSQDKEVWMQKIKERATGSYKKNASKQPDDVSKRQETLKSELEQELRTPFKPSKPKFETNLEDSLDDVQPLNLETEELHNYQSSSLNDVVPAEHTTAFSSSASSTTRVFVPPSSSAVFPMSQPILPSKFESISSVTKRPEAEKLRKISSIFKRRSLEIPNGLSQGSHSLSSPMFSKR